VNTINPFLISKENAALMNGGRGVDPFGLFSLTHFIFLVIMAAIVALIVWSYRRAAAPSGSSDLSVSADPRTSTTRCTIRIVLAIAVFVLEFGKDAALAFTNQFTLANWPFELCGLGVFIVAWDAIHSNKASRAVLYSLILPGAFFALLTPDWVTSPAINLFTWQAFLIHSLMVAYILMRLVSKEFVPNFRDLWTSVVFLAVFGLLNWRLNAAWGTNFMFLGTPVPGSPLQPIYDVFGNFYVFGIALLVLFIWVLLYLPWEIVRIHSARAVRLAEVQVRTN
jgi:hypothetical integral membrane protein (TIGR02206 family)